MKNNMKNSARKPIAAILFAVIMMASVLAVIPSVQAVPDDYFVYAKYYPGYTGLGACGGYVDADGNEYIYYWIASPNAGTAYKVQVETDGDPNMHLSNPEATGTMANRTFTNISNHSCIADMGVSFWVCDADEFYVDDTGIYLGPGTNGIHKWNHSWGYQGQIGPKLSGAQSLAYDKENGIWYAGHANRTIYSLSDTDNDSSYMDETWTSKFTHPDYAGSHHDGMEYVKQNMWISDMTSDKIAQWKKVGGVWTEIQVFNYSEAAVVEGMGFGPNKHFWITGFYSNYIYEVGGGKLQIALEGIPDQCVLAGESFETFDLDNYTVGNIDHYGYSGNVNLSVSIDAENVTTITYLADWTGSETITFIAYNASNGVIDSDDATFTVDPVPIVGDIPNQTAPFETFDLDGYLLIGSASPVTWSASDPGGNWTVVIDGDNNVTVTAPDGAKDPVTITFTATATACGGDVSDSDDATFIPNQPPDVSKAHPSIDCLWPPNHKFVDITIEGITDPDGDMVTITITNITSDEPTASIEGAGGAEHAPDADGIGTDTASLRAERSGTGNGRVYEITFVASDGIAETEGSVTVCVPHDRRKGTCDCIDDGQNYDATAVN